MKAVLFWGQIDIPRSVLGEWRDDVVRVERCGDITSLVVEAEVFNLPDVENLLHTVARSFRDNLYELTVAELLRLAKKFRIEDLSLSFSNGDTISYRSIEDADLFPYLFQRVKVQNARFIAGGRWAFYSDPYFSVRDGVMLQHLIEAVGASKWRERAWRL